MFGQMSGLQQTNSGFVQAIFVAERHQATVVYDHRIDPFEDTFLMEKPMQNECEVRFRHLKNLVNTYEGDQRM